MLYFRLCCFLSLFTAALQASGEMSSLLLAYEDASELSKITRSDSAGFVDIYTRADLERMQVKTLDDVLKLSSIPFTSRAQSGVVTFVKPTKAGMPNSAIRLFINDKPSTSGVYGSTSKMYASMSIEHIDHIEIYKTASSLEFGGEPGTVIIKLYTKLPQREEGGKVKAAFDTDGSTLLDAYYAQTLSDDFSYLIFANTNKMKRDTFTNQTKELNSDTQNENIFASFDYTGWKVDISHYKKQTNPFLGKGIKYTPEETNGIESKEDYIHISKTFESSIKLKLLYSDLKVTEDFVDNGGIYAGALGMIKSYHNTNKNRVFSSSLEKIHSTKNNRFFAGVSFKHDTFATDSTFDAGVFSYDNILNTYSVYAENSYDFGTATRLITSLKFDFYRYDKEVEDKNNYIARVGIIKNIDSFQLKAFYTRSYYLNPLASLYSAGYNAPFITNPDLQNAEQELSSIEAKYSGEKSTLNLRFSYINVKDYVLYDKTKGFINATGKKYFTQYELKYQYRFNRDNKIEAVFYGGDNGDVENFSPSNGAVIKLFNRYNKVDFYNDLVYRDSYSTYDIDVRRSFDFTSSVKYHYSESLSFGIRGENLFDDAYQQAYKNFPYAISVYDRKIWFTMEYMF